ncbi:hypothetical protein L914_18746 [Phytophthora nicotianae]|uniref:No apical meristem-associated C-terminal domain-containing protein n=1 Tax=Phytophthora nicotianae TaxID=4792 RepID=W2MCM9_PHYNI|nr:hypothetical protein L914_18746 [Phytophthora nicotianae]
MSKAKGCERDEENHLFQAQVNITKGQAIAPRKRQIQREDSAGSRASDDGSSTEVSSDEHGGESSVSTGDVSSLVGAFERPRGACKKRAKLELVEAAGDRAAAQAQRDLATAVTAQVTVMKLQLAVSKRKLQVLQEQS